MALAHQRLGAGEEAAACMARAMALDGESYIVCHLRNTPEFLEDTHACNSDCTHTSPSRYPRAL